MVLIQLIGGPTALLEVDGLRLVTDPTFDQPGDYPRPNAPTLVKLAGPAVAADEMARADVVLLSHDQHADNLDESGRAYLGQVPLTLTTPSGADRLTCIDIFGNERRKYLRRSGRKLRHGLAVRGLEC